MAKTPEAKVRDPVVAYSKRNGIGHIRMTFRPGTHTGWPDDIFLIPGGRPVFIEFKAPGKKPTPKQQRKIALLETLGYDVYWTDSSDAAKKILDAALRVGGM